MGTKNKSWHASNDTPEQIQKCLSCKRPECVDCLSSHMIRREQESERSARKYAEKSGAIYVNGLRLNKTAQAILHFYPTATCDREIAEQIGRNTLSVGSMRRKLGLPSFRGTTVEERTRLADQFFSEGGVLNGGYL